MAESLRKQIDKLIDRCYIKGSPDYPKLIIFLSQKFLNEVMPIITERIKGIEVSDKAIKQSLVFRGYSIHLRPDQERRIYRDITEEAIQRVLKELEE